jgi:hypothetical protein
MGRISQAWSNLAPPGANLKEAFFRIGRELQSIAFAMQA